MGFKGITVNTPPEAEPHIYAEDDAAIFRSIVGTDGVMNIGKKFETTILSNNKIRIADGVVCVGGHFARTPYAEYDDLTIENGRSGMNRNDLIVARIESSGTQGIDTMKLEVVKGTAAATAHDPAITKEDLYNVGRTREYPLYRVKLEGLNIVAVEQMFEVVPTIPELEKKIENLIGVSIGFTTSVPGMLTLPNGTKIVYGITRSKDMEWESGLSGYSKVIDLSEYGLDGAIFALASPRYSQGFPLCSVCYVNSSSLKIASDTQNDNTSVQWLVIG